MNTVLLNTVHLDGAPIIKKVSGEGGGSTILNQSKSVEITENGSVSVTPDAGYTGLSKVDVNVDVPTQEINNQDKAIDIVENGTTEIVADSGYTGLGKVQINTNVAGGDTSAPEYIGFRIYAPGFGEGYEYSFSVYNNTGTWQDAVDDYGAFLGCEFSEQDGNVYVAYGDNSYMIYKEKGDNSWNPSFSDPVKVTDKIESRTYYIDTDSQGIM